MFLFLACRISISIPINIIPFFHHSNIPWDATDVNMKIATFNVNSVRSRIEVILDWLARRKPDVLCMQETKVEDKLFPAEAFESVGYHPVFKGEKSYNGVALVAREQPLDVKFGLGGANPDESRLVCAKVGSVYVVNTYVPQGRDIEHKMYMYKLEWFKRLRAWFTDNFTPDSNVVWLGDMNVAPEVKDIHNAERQEKNVCFHEDVRKAFAETMSWGFVDVFRMHHPEPGQFTYFDYRTHDSVQRNMGWRVDHILATRKLAMKCTNCAIDMQPRLAAKPSDHTVMMAEFNLERKGR